MTAARPFGAGEAGEGAITPTVPAILTAVYDPTGVLLQELPPDAGPGLSGAQGSREAEKGIRNP